MGNGPTLPFLALPFQVPHGAFDAGDSVIVEFDQHGAIAVHEQLRQLIVHVSLASSRRVTRDGDGEGMAGAGAAEVAGRGAAIEPHDRRAGAARQAGYVPAETSSSSPSVSRS